MIDIKAVNISEKSISNQLQKLLFVNILGYTQPFQHLRVVSGHENVFYLSQQPLKHAEKPSDIYPLIIIFKMIRKHQGRKQLAQIIYSRPNMINSSRLVLIYFSIVLQNTSPYLSYFLMIFSVLLDYLFGIDLENSSQYTFSGDCFNWLIAVFTHTVVALWWLEIEPELIAVISTLLMVEIITMLLDLIVKSYAFQPQVKLNSWMSFISKNATKCKAKDYDCRGLGSWNETVYFLCIISRILYLKTEQDIWHYLFVINFPLAIGYFWMNLAYVKYILDSWNEGIQDNRIVLKFSA